MRSNWASGAAVLVGFGIAWSAAPTAAVAGSSRPMVLTGFLQLGRTDVGRNEVLEFRFSNPVLAKSVTNRTLQVNERTPAGERPAVGARIVSGNVVRFDPRRTQRNYDGAQLANSVIVERDHVLGFAANATYVVRLRTGADVTTIRAKNGGRLARAFTSTIATGDKYDDPVPGQPSFIGDHGSGAIGFDPPRHAANGLIDDYAVMVLEFSEPILPSSMRLGETVIVTLDGQPLAGTVTPDLQSPDSRRFLVTPTNGWPTQSTKLGVQLTTGITDLAGNALKRPFKGGL